MKTITKDSLIEDLKNLGISSGDTVLIRTKLSVIGKINKRDVLEALLNIIGAEGTLVGLAFTKSFTIKKPNPENYFHIKTPTYAGALAQMMLDHPDAKRSVHPMCSFVAIGKHAEEIVNRHDHLSPAYEPMRKLMDLNVKGVLIGCLEESPGFTTAHLAEYDLGLHKRVIFPWFTRVYFQNEGKMKLFRRKDVGLCSQSYSKFYPYYQKEGLLKEGMVGNAVSILVPLKEAYKIEYSLMKSDAKFNICDNALCFACNVRRWDRLHKMPGILYKFLKKKLFNK